MAAQTQFASGEVEPVIPLTFLGAVGVSESSCWVGKAQPNCSVGPPLSPSPRALPLPGAPPPRVVPQPGHLQWGCSAHSRAKPKLPFLLHESGFPGKVQFMPHGTSPLSTWKQQEGASEESRGYVFTGSCPHCTSSLVTEECTGHGPPHLSLWAPQTGAGPWLPGLKQLQTQRPAVCRLFPQSTLALAGCDPPPPRVAPGF